MNEYMRIAHDLSVISKHLEEGTISSKDLPLQDVIKLVEEIFIGRKPREFIYLYAKLLNKGIKHEDGEITAAVLRLLALQTLIISVDKQMGIVKNYDCYIQHFFNCEKIAKWHNTHPAVEKSANFSGKGVVYSVITGGYDTVKDPEYVNPELDYILFTDNPEIVSNVWQVRLIDRIEGLDDARLSRRIKVLGHLYLAEYDYSIYVDGAFKIKGNFLDYIERYSKLEPMLCFNHPVNDCIYMEKESCTNLKKDDTEVMDRQIRRYRQEGYPEHNGLIAGGILVREIHNERVKQVMETWWEEMLNGSKRDQLSFNYACWKNDFVYDSTDLYIFDNEYTIYYAHSQKAESQGRKK